MKLSRQKASISSLAFSKNTCTSSSLGVLSLESPKIIAERRFQRDGIRQDECTINDFQCAEKAYAIEIARQLNIPLEVSSGASDLGRIVEIIKTGGC